MAAELEGGPGGQPSAAAALGWVSTEVSMEDMSLMAVQTAAYTQLNS